MIRELIAIFKSQADLKSLDKADGLLARLRKNGGLFGDVLKRIDGQFAGLAAATTIAAFAHSFVNESRELNELSLRLRVSTRDLQTMGALGRSVGLDLNGTASVLGRLRDRVTEATRGLGDGGYQFRRLGVQIRQANGAPRELVEILGDVSIALARVQSPYRRQILTERLLGAEGRRLTDVFSGNQDALREMQTALAQAGGGISERAIKSGLRLGRAWAIAGLSVDTLRSRIAEYLLPILERVVWAFVRVQNFINSTTIAENGLAIATVALGTKAAIAMGRWAVANAALLGQFLLVGAAIGMVVLVVDDLINLFRGGPSVIGGFIDEIAGVGTAAEVVNALRLAFRDIYESIQKISETMPGVNRMLDAIPGMTLSGQREREQEQVNAANARLREALRNRARGAELGFVNPAAPRATDPFAGVWRPTTVAVPAQPPQAPARGRFVALPPGADGRGRTITQQIQSAPRVTVNVTAGPNALADEIGDATRRATLNAFAQSNRDTVRQLSNSGLALNRGSRE